MNAIFELKRTCNDKYMFSLKGANREVILTSGLYETQSDAEDGIAFVKRNAVIPERYGITVNAEGRFFFILYAANKVVIARSEVFTSREALEKGIASVKQIVSKAEIVDVTSPTPM